ncbi:MAG: hypothetical protein P1U74_11450 [Legionellaceae bacterium]|nr:hypothetical protein [Legionellaceae bacterium]
MIQASIKILLLSIFLLPAAFSASNTKDINAHSSVEVNTIIKDKDDWLSNLKGLPDMEEIENLSKRVDEVMKDEKNKTCTSINPRLRKMIFLHFATYQKMLNARNIYLTDEKIEHWAHVFGMLLKESSGDTTNVTSMTGRSYTTYQSKSDLERWRKIAKLTRDSEIPLNYQTNFGLTQLSIDRLFVALKLAVTPSALQGTNFSHLNTAVAIRRLIWFYQDFAQGRLTQSHDRIHNHEKGNPEYSTRFAFGISTALLLCGSHYMFYEGYHGKADEVTDLADAMASIAYCKIGDKKGRFGVTEENKKCFAQWVTLCPTLNFDIAMLTPLKYFSTRNAAPVCENTFKALLKKKPTVNKAIPTKKVHHQHHSKVKEQNKPFGFRVKNLLDSVADLVEGFFTTPNNRSHKN